MRCLCPFLHGIPPPPLLGMLHSHALWHINHLLFCFCNCELFPLILQSGHGKLARQMTLLLAFCDYLGNAVKVTIYSHKNGCKLVFAVLVGLVVDTLEICGCRI